MCLLNMVKGPKLEVNICENAPLKSEAQDSACSELCLQICLYFLLVLTSDCLHMPTNSCPFRIIHSHIFRSDADSEHVQMYLRTFHFKYRKRKRSEILLLLFVYVALLAAGSLPRGSFREVTDQNRVRSLA